MGKFIKEVVLSVLITSLILYGLSAYQFGIRIDVNAHPVQVFLFLGVIFWIVNFGLKKLLHLITFPLKFLTLGLSSLLINVGVLYFFQWLVNSNFAEYATVVLSPMRYKVLCLSFIISLAYTLLSKLFK